MNNNYEEEEHSRVCSVCGKRFSKGRYNEDCFEYYCSDECLDKVYDYEEIEKLYDDGDGCLYWTSWEE